MTNSEILGVKMNKVLRGVRDREREKEVSMMMPKLTNRRESSNIC